jgi:hypothetical protein
VRDNVTGVVEETVHLVIVEIIMVVIKIQNLRKGGDHHLPRKGGTVIVLKKRTIMKVRTSKITMKIIEDNFLLE